jgi:hypothetical protein
MSPNPPYASLDEERAALPGRVTKLETNLDTLRRDVADEFKDLRSENRRQTEAILAKIEAQGRDFSHAQAEALRKGQFSLSSTFKTLIAAGGFLLAIVGAGATALKAPIEADIARDRTDIQELKRTTMGREELMVRLTMLQREVERGDRRFTGRELAE